MFGWVAAAIGVSAILAQVLRIARSGSTAGVSTRLWQVTSGTMAAWAVHGFLVGSPQMQWPNIIGATLAAGLLVFVLRQRRRSVPPHLGLLVLVALALVAVDIWLGALVFGLVVAVPQLVGQVAQLRSLLESENPEGVSAGYLAIFVFGQSLWFVYGIAFNDWALIVCAGMMVCIASVNLVVCLVRQARARVRLAA